MNVKSAVKGAITAAAKQYYLAASQFAAPGTAAWLVGREMKYGGRVTNLPRRKVSPRDHRTAEELAKGGMTGGDRMFHHGYAQWYATYLRPILEVDDLTLIEIGVLAGTGLAVWCDLFKTSRVIGLDIDLSHVRGNLEALERRGAFSANRPELYEFDQLRDNENRLENILGGARVNIVIDDGLHSSESVLTTITSMRSHLSQEFIYFVEDNAFVHHDIRRLFPEWQVYNAGELTVIQGRGN